VILETMPCARSFLNFNCPLTVDLAVVCSVNNAGF
jgi:hypothetical protein